MRLILRREQDALDLVDRSRGKIIVLVIEWDEVLEEVVMKKGLAAEKWGKERHGQAA